MVLQSLHPPRSTSRFLLAYEQALAYEPRVGSGVTAIRDAKGRRLPTWLQFLLYEYGLIELTPYVPNFYTLLDEGRAWQIDRDTFAAVLRGLGWVSAQGSIVEAPSRRNWWNSFQVNLNDLPPADSPNLSRIEKIVELSAPFRSDFRRGVNGYDIGAGEGDYTKLDASILDRESGVRLTPSGALWSFGRVTEWAHELTEAEGTALGNWLAHASLSSFLVDFENGTAIVDDLPVDLDDVVEFSRGTSKWHSDVAGHWQEFGVNEIARLDSGVLIEPAADRLTQFAPELNPLDDATAATVILIGVDDPFGGDQAIRVMFEGDAGRTLLVPADGLQPDTVYSVSFFARLISSIGYLPPGGDAGFQSFFSQLTANEWVRVEGLPFTTDDIAGQWLDLTLAASGATVVIDLFGFQVEEGPKVTSPIPGPDLTGHRDEDLLSLGLPDGLNNVVVTFGDGTGQSFLGVEGPFEIRADILNRPLIANVANASSTTWKSMAFPWTEANFPWASDAVVQRQITLAHWFEGRGAYLALKNDAGQVIGYRRARAVRQVLPDYNGPFAVLSATYAPTQSGRSVIVEAMTDAGNGAGQIARSIEIVIGGTLLSGIPPGRLWLDPDELVGGVSIASKTVNIPLRATVRERLKLLLRF